MRFFKLFAMILVLMSSVWPAIALVPIPEESGFSGFVGFGGTFMHMESNLISGNDFGDVGQEVIPSIHGKPDLR